MPRMIPHRHVNSGALPEHRAPSGFAFGGVGVSSQIGEQLEEFRRLTFEQVIRYERLDSGSCRALGCRRANDRDLRESWIEERHRFRHDQVGLELLRRELRRVVKVGERQVWVCRVGQRRQSRLHGVACLVVPGLEVANLGAADGQQYPQYLGTGDTLRQLRIQAAAALLDETEVEGGRIGDRLDVPLRREIGVAAWYCRELALCQAGNRLGELETRV